jgi:hypothetical protein
MRRSVDHHNRVQPRGWYGTRALRHGPEYVDVGVHRRQPLRGREARLAGDGRSFQEIAQVRRPWRNPEEERRRTKGAA